MNGLAGETPAALTLRRPRCPVNPSRRAKQVKQDSDEMVGQELFMEELGQVQGGTKAPPINLLQLVTLAPYEVEVGPKEPVVYYGEPTTTQLLGEDFLPPVPRK
jgi:hypothetical protein